MRRPGGVPSGTVTASSDGLDRRAFLGLSARTALGLLAAGAGAQPGRAERATPGETMQRQPSSRTGSVNLFLCGDVMTGRGIDQVLPHAGDPRIHERYVKSALGYVELAERKVGAIPRPVDADYVWGDALAELARVTPDVRIVNLETSVTTSDTPEPKGINYRMHPDNVSCLQAAEIDCCVLANNHVLDWGVPGLEETLETLRKAQIRSAGAGRSLAEAQRPATLEVPGKGCVVVYAFGSGTSGIPPSWAARADRPGVNLLRDLSEETARSIAAGIRAAKRPRDVVVASLHWGPNWGYEIDREQRRFAQMLVREGAVDVVHGHSSHHAKGIEVHEGRLILYGCGDFLNDYEGIAGNEEFRDDLALMYFPSLDAATGKLERLDITPLQIRRFRLNRISQRDASWLRDTLGRACEKLGTRLELNDDRRLALRWA